MALTIGPLIAMAISGAASIPAQHAEIDAQYEKAKRLCRQTRWNLHRTEQMKMLTDSVEASYEKYYGPALDMAQTAEQTWQLSQVALGLDRKIMLVNTGILVILMVVYVLVAYFLLFQKRKTLTEAFQAVYNVHFQD